MAAKSELRVLADLISAEVDTIEDVYSSSGKPFPSLNDPNPEPLIDDPKFARSAMLVMAAASRLIKNLKNPYAAMQEACGAMYTSGFLGVIVETNVTEALREAGPQGMHVDDIATKIGIDSGKLAQGLRYLCAREHIFREISPNVFTNNRLSSTLDTGLSFDDIKDLGPHRYDTADGCAAMIGQLTDVNMTGAASLSKVLVNPKTSFTRDPTKAPVMYSKGFDKTFWEWLEQPGNEKELHRFGPAMRTFDKLYAGKAVVTGYDWSSLAAGSLVVDVGGGVGGSVIHLSKAYPHLRYVVQDRPPTAADGEKFWSTSNPDALATGLVKFQAHSFFDPQPIKNATVFLIRLVIHNWEDSKARQILQNLRDAAAPETKLVLFEEVIPYTCPMQRDEGSDATGDIIDYDMPRVLDGNFGAAKGMTYVLDMHMLNLCNALQRTVKQWEILLKESGWNLVSIREGSLPAIVCVPL